jgi:hypothetical protein
MGTGNSIIWVDREHDLAAVLRTLSPAQLRGRHA